LDKLKVRNRIRELRFEHGEMTQQELATAVGCSRQTIVLLEQGRYSPSLTLAFLIARHFDRKVDAVFEFVDE
jgi:putative transcriptional regulator